MDNKKNLYQALIKCTFPSVKRSGKGNYGDYSLLLDYYDAVLPTLHSNGLHLQHNMSEVERGVRFLITRVIHTETGEEEKDERYVINEKPGNQAWGAAETYAKKHAIQTLLGVFGETDDDGQAEQDFIDKKASAPPKKDNRSDDLIKQIGNLIVEAENSEELLESVNVDQLTSMGIKGLEEALNYVKKYGQFGE